MKRTLLFLLIFIPCTAVAQPAELIVRLEPGAASLQQALEGAKSGQSEAPDLFDGVSAAKPVFAQSARKARGGAIPAYVLAVADSSRLRTLRSAWASRSDVRYVQENVSFSIETSSERYRRFSDSDNAFADSLDHLDVIRAREAQDITRGNADVRIGIIDTGVDLDHPDLEGQAYINAAEDINGNGRFDSGDLNGVDDDGNGFVDDVVGYDFVDRPGLDLVGEYEDRDPDPRPDTTAGISGHGTFVAGITSGVPANAQQGGVLGVAPGARFVSLRAFGADGRGQTDDIAAAIVYAANQRFEVVNLSFGRDRPAPLIEEAVRYAADRGVVVVASAGNQATDDAHYPSDYPDAISVMWLAEDGTGLPDRFSQSQYGIGVDIGAPGSNVFTTRYPGMDVDRDTLEADDLYGPVSGSSFAAPQVAGAVALLRSLDPTLDPASVRSIITDTATDLQEPGWNHVTAAGRLDVLRALQEAIPAAVEITSPEFNGGVSGATPVAITGSAVNPGFSSYSLYIAEGTSAFDDRFDPWEPITETPIETPVINDTLAVWDVAALSPSQYPDGEYTLRLVVQKRDGSTVEDRRRIYIDRTPPNINVRSAMGGLISGEYGVLADVETDDVTQIDMRVVLNGQSTTAESEYEVRRHSLRAIDPTGQGGRAEVIISATNTAGLVTADTVEVDVPPRRFNSSLFNVSSTSVSAGRVLPQATDFDEDGLLEVVVNQRKQGGISDTLRFFEWAGSDFLPADTLVASVIPRDLGDPDADGLQDLLTQVVAVTLMLEQPDQTSVPSQLAFIDTTGLDGDSETKNDLIGTLLTDIDRDGKGEIVGHNGQQWRFLEASGGDYIETFRLDNPTSAASVDSAALANRFGPAIAADGDFDGDGRTDFLVGDRDGDLIVYEAVADDSMRVAWMDETDYVDAGDRMATGDFDGDGQTDFATFRQNYPLTLPNGEVEPSIGLYQFWSAAGDDEYAVRGEIPIAGEVAPDGGIESFDYDGDGRDEIAISHPPELFIADFDINGGWRVVYHNDGTSAAGKILSASMVSGDFNGNGSPELLVSTSRPVMQRFEFDAASAQYPPPSWITARPDDASSILLRWKAPGADSVTVFDGPEGTSLSRALSTTDSTVTLARSNPREVALQAWYNGSTSPLSNRRTIRPHDPATVASIDPVSPTTIELVFTEPLATSTRAEQFDFEGEHPVGLTFGRNEAAVVLRFAARPSTASGTLQWDGVVDRSGLAVSQTSATVTFPKQAEAGFIVTDWTVLDQRRVEILFSQPVQPDDARDLAKYTVQPDPGTVASVAFDDSTPNRVVVTVDGTVIGANGQRTQLRLGDLTSTSGETLAEKSRGIRLSEPADNLDDVFVYPNPYRASQHGNALTIAGLPSQSTIRVYSTDGRLVRVLSKERSLTGGREWDLRDSRGEKVPAGIYIFRVESPSDEPVVRRAAVIR
ncbi:S8 family serine peptidase [Longibacter salinarum]|nr:S8 family serine peptidase [Longibacter salinarum]